VNTHWEANTHSDTPKSVCYQIKLLYYKRVRTQPDNLIEIKFNFQFTFFFIWATERFAEEPIISTSGIRLRQNNDELSLCRLMDDLWSHSLDKSDKLWGTPSHKHVYNTAKCTHTASDIFFNSCNIWWHHAWEIYFQLCTWYLKNLSLIYLNKGFLRLMTKKKKKKCLV